MLTDHAKLSLKIEILYFMTTKDLKKDARLGWWSGAARIIVLDFKSEYIPSRIKGVPRFANAPP